MLACLCVFFLFQFLLSYSTDSFAKEAEILARDTNWYGYLFLGDNLAGVGGDELRTVNYKGGGPYEWGIGLGRYYNKHFSLEGTFEYWGERYERSGAVIAGTENNVIQAGGLGISLSAVYNYQQRNFHAYLGAGAGYFITGILVTEPGSGLLTDQGAPADKWLPGFHISMGSDYRIKDNHKLGLEIKHRILEADFGVYTNGKVNVGGTFLLLLYRHSSQ